MQHVSAYSIPTSSPTHTHTHTHTLQKMQLWEIDAFPYLP